MRRQNSNNRIAGTEYCNRDKETVTEQPGQEGWTRYLEQDSLDKSARTKKLRQDNQDKRAGTEQP
jgi:hypothetical protein